MLTADLDHVTTLEELYSDIRSQQEEYHGKEYCSHHDAIVKCLEGCESYKELGTHQGATAAAAILAGAKKVTLVDRDHYRINPNIHLFEHYCDNHNIELNVVESDSRSVKVVGPVDVLLIDSKHVYDHCKEELEVHGDWVKRYIILHDTAAKPDLHRAAKEYCNNMKWKVVEYNTENVGYTILERL